MDHNAHLPHAAYALLGQTVVRSRVFRVNFQTISLHTPVFNFKSWEKIELYYKTTLAYHQETIPLMFFRNLPIIKKLYP